MEIQLPYGEGKKTLRIPPDVEIDFLAPADAAALSDLEGAFADACERPVGAPALSEYASAQSRVVILVSDLTRGKGMEALLPLTVDYLKTAGVHANAITVLVARGTHRKLTKSEKRFFSTNALSGIRIAEHNSDDHDSHSALLLTRRGTPVRVNAALKDADLIVLLAPVSFHYFAGFGGGRKLVLPGCADRQSILANHRLSLVNKKPVTLHPRCRAGRLDGNPVHEDMLETVEALRNVFAINFFANADGEVCFVNTGDAVTSHRVACEEYSRYFRRRVDQPYDVVVLSAGGLPYDINLLQSHKALRHAAGGMKNGGTILFFAECGEEVGSESLEAALKLKPDKFLAEAHDNYALNNQTAVSLRDLTSRFEIGMVSAMNVDVLLAAGVKPSVNAEAFLAEALERHATNRLAVVVNGASLLLQPAGESQS